MTQTRIPLPWFNPIPDYPCFCQSGKVFTECCGLDSPDRDPPHGVTAQRGFLDEAICRKWVSKLKSRPIKKSAVHRIEKSTSGYLSTRGDSTRVCTEVNPGTLRKQISDCVGRAFREVAAQYGDTVDWFEAPTILRYRPGGYFMAHADSCLLDPASHNWFKVKDRDLSLLIYLNDEFTGGSVNFTNFNYRFRPRTGDLLVFPSDNRYIHEAEKVESGIRYVVVSWATIVGSRRVSDQPPQGVIRL